MNWNIKKVMRKNIYKELKNIESKETINLPILTNGLDWKNTTILSSSNQYKTSDNEGLFVNKSKKIDDNVFEITCNSYKYSIEELNYPIYVNATSSTNIITFTEINQQLLDGILLNTNRIAVLTLTGVVSGAYEMAVTKFGFNIYCNDTQIFSNDKILTQFKYKDILDTNIFFFSIMFVETIYINPNEYNNKPMKIRLEKLHDFIITYSLGLRFVLKITYLDANENIPTSNNIQFIAYEEV